MGKDNTYRKLEKDFAAIRDERGTQANTANRIGSAFLSLLSYIGSAAFLRKGVPDTAEQVITFLKGIVAKAVSYFQGIVNRGDINNHGDITNKGNINNTGDITNTGSIMTNNLTVTGKATFFELEIQKAKAAGGMSVNSAGTFHIDAVEEMPDGFVCYQRAEKDGVKLLQTCEPKDQMMCSNGMNSLPLQGRGDQTNDGKPHAIGNHYYWRLATEAPTKVVMHTIDGKEEKCLKLVLSKTDHSKNTVDIPQVGDDLVQIGNPDNKERQSVIMTCAYNSFDGDLKAPYWVQYDGVNDYKLSTHKRTWFAANGSQVTGNFKVQSDNGGLEPIEDYMKSLAQENSTRPNLLWGSDLNLDGVDTTSKAAIEKHLGVVLSNGIELGNREMFEYLKGGGVAGADAIRIKNAYKREGWRRWTNISWRDVPLKPHTRYTISVWVKFKSYGGKGRMYVDSTSDDGRYCFGGYLYKEHFYDRADIDDWQRVRYVFDSGASRKMSNLNFCCIADEEEGAQCEIWLCHPKLEEGEVATPWCAYDYMTGHSLVAKVFMEGSYRNGFTKGVKSYVKVYYDGQEVTDFKVSYRYKDDWQKDWSEPLVTNSGVWGDEQRDGSTLFVEYAVEYKGLKALATGRLDNIQDGTQGVPGKDGRDGKDGRTSYFHVKYADVASPTSSSQMNDTSGDYMGTYVDFTQADSDDPRKYTWVRTKGAQGADGTNGVPGKNGADGRTSYLHIKYSNDGGGTFTSNSGEDVGVYIGQYVDFNMRDSDNPRDYRWALIKGKNGINGKDGINGKNGLNGKDGRNGTDGKDAVTYKLIPIDEKVLAYIKVDKRTKKKTNKVDVRLGYKVMKSAGEQVSFIYDLAAEGMTLTEDGGLGGFGSANGAHGLQRLDMEYKERPDDSYVVTLTKDGRIVDRRVLPITFKPKVVFDIDTVNGSLTSEIKTVKGKMSKIEQTAEHISLTVDGGIRPNLLWGSDLDLSEVQDIIKKAYELGNSIKEKTEEKAEWKRKRDQADSDDDRMRYQDGMDVCDRKITQAQGELAKCREAIAKHLGIVISGDMEIGNRDMFEYLKGEGVGGSDAIRFKNAYKREDWAKWTSISWHDVPLKPNTTYTISVWVKFKSYGKKGRMYVDCNSDDGRWNFGGYQQSEHNYSREDIDKWTRVKYVFDSGKSRKIKDLFFACIADEEEGAQCEIWLCRPKLEEGNTATPWCAYDGTVEALLASGLDIKEKKFTATADNFVVQNNKGERTFMVDENGKINNGMLSLDGLDAKRAVIKRLRFQSNSVAPYFVTEESMKEFAAYCTRYYAGYGANPLLPFDVAMFFVFLIKPKWLTNIDQGYNRDFSPRSRDIAVSKGMARGFQVDYFSFALELFWHNMVGKTVTIANATNENISFGVKLKTEVLDDMGKKVTQIGGRLDNLPNFPERCVERINLLPGQMASFKYTLFSGAPMNVLVREVHTKGFFLLQDLFDFSYYKKLFEVGYDTEQGFNIFDKKYIDLFNTDKEHVEPKGGFPKKKR